jgi:hypothetical protein
MVFTLENSRNYKSNLGQEIKNSRKNFKKARRDLIQAHKHQGKEEFIEILKIKILKKNKCQALKIQIENLFKI